jgi:hypothetical protein
MVDAKSLRQFDNLLQTPPVTYNEQLRINRS